MEAAAEGNEWCRDGSSGEARRLMEAYAAVMALHARLLDALCGRLVMLIPTVGGGDARRRWCLGEMLMPLMGGQGDARHQGDARR